MSDSPSDPDLAAMTRLAADDDRALNEIMDRWSGRLAAFLFRMTGDHASACDLAQETFVRLYQHRHSYRPGASFSTYLFRIATNLARNHARWRRRHPAVSLNDESAPIHEPVATQAEPDLQAQNSERVRLIESALESLPANLREAILLFTFHDMSYAQISEATRCTPKAVETRIYRARQLLRSALARLDS